MSNSTSLNSTLSIVPLGAGDLVDRAVRFYRGNFWTFIMIAAPPVVVGTVFSVAWTFLSRMLVTGNSIDPFENIGYYILLWLGNILIWFTQTVATLSVMGGASRNFVRHLLFGEPLAFKETYLNTWNRIAGLIAASSIITFLLGIIGLFIFYFGFAIGGLGVLAAVAVLQSIPELAFIVGTILVIVAVLGSLWLFFLVASRFAYIPQVMMVEGQGVFSAFARSASLASGNVKRFAFLFVFTFVAIYSALAIFYVPLAWYASATGVELFAFDADAVPGWYEIAFQLIWQFSLILLSPVWMVGLCLLYVDERVRHEGYDIELMAARQLGEIPAVSVSYINPLQPALASQAPVTAPAAAKKSPFTTLGLE